MQDGGDNAGCAAAEMAHVAGSRRRASRGGGGGSNQQRVQSPLLALLALLCCRRPYDEGFQQQPATELAVWQHMLPLLHRL